MYYQNSTPEGASDFEAAFGLIPLGEAVTPERLARLEAIAGLFISAVTDPSSSGALIWTGTAFPSRAEVPVPSETAMVNTLNQFRAPEEITARGKAEFADYNDY